MSSRSKMDFHGKDKKETHIQAFARLRPFNKQENECHAKKCLDVTQRDISVHLRHNTKKYVFDKVFDMASRQKEVYTTILHPIIEEVISGYNCTVFAYGQTGTGKTYTMVGFPSLTDLSYTQDSDAGIIPRAIGHIFEKVKKNVDLEMTVRVSYMELYNEVLIDLLSKEEKTLKIYEDQKNKGSVQIHGLEEVSVFNENQVYEILQKGNEKRQTAATLMNVQSSRSHTVFTITLHSRESQPDGEELVKTGKLNLVDLAGSENILRSGAKEKNAREAGSINQSLLTLGRVIKALVDKSAHVPYRESKLTRILQDSLGGRTKTTIIATVSPASNNLEETMSTLDYAHRARDITNRPEVNQKMSKAGLIQRYLEEIQCLKKDIIATRSHEGIYLHPENYKSMISESEKRKEDLLKFVVECSELEGRVKELERVREELEQIYCVTKRDFQDAAASLEKSKAELQELYKEREIHQDLIDKYDEAQTAFEQHTRALSEALDKHISEHRILRNKVHSLYSVNMKNEHSCRNLLNIHTSQHNTIKDSISSIYNNVQSSTNVLRTMVDDLNNQYNVNFKVISERAKSTTENFAQIGRSIECILEHIQNVSSSSYEIDHNLKLEGKFHKTNEFFKEDLDTLLEELGTLKTQYNNQVQEHKNIVNAAQSRITEINEDITKNVLNVKKLTSDNFNLTKSKMESWIEYTKEIEDSYDKCGTNVKGELKEIGNKIQEVINRAIISVDTTINAGKSKVDHHAVEIRNTIESCEKFHNDHVNHLQDMLETCTKTKTLLTTSKNNYEALTDDSQSFVNTKIDSLLLLCDDVKADCFEYTHIIENLLSKSRQEKESKNLQLDYLNRLLILLKSKLNSLTNEYANLTIVDDSPVITQKAQEVLVVLESLQKSVIDGEKVNKRYLEEANQIIADFVNSFEIARPKGDTPQKDLEFGRFKTPKKISKSVLTFPSVEESQEI